MDTDTTMPEFPLKGTDHFEPGTAGMYDAARIDRLVKHYESSIMAHLDQAYVSSTTWSDRLADRIAAFGGSWSFIVVFSAVLIAWIVWNLLPIFAPARFDPPPFILLNLCLSFTAAFQAPIIMMSQNRQAARDKREAIIDFALNFKSEWEVDDMQGHLHRIEARLGDLERMLSQVANSRL